MRWIHTTLSLSFGDEDGADTVNARFSGTHCPASRGDFVDGMMVGPPEPASFAVYRVEIQGDDGWIVFPKSLHSDSLNAQLQQIAIQWQRDEDERAAEFQAECRREDRATFRLPTPANSDAMTSEKVA